MILRVSLVGHNFCFGDFFSPFFKRERELGGVFVVMGQCCLSNKNLLSALIVQQLKLLCIHTSDNDDMDQKNQHGQPELTQFAYSYALIE